MLPLETLPAAPTGAALAGDRSPLTRSRIRHHPEDARRGSAGL